MEQIGFIRARHYGHHRGHFTRPGQEVGDTRLEGAPGFKKWYKLVFTSQSLWLFLANEPLQIPPRRFFHLGFIDLQLIAQVYSGFRTMMMMVIELIIMV